MPNTYYDYQRITFSNQNFNFEFYYKAMENVMMVLSSEKNLFKCNKTITAFIGNFYYGITDDDYKLKIENEMIKLNDELVNDPDIQKLIKYEEQNIDVELSYIPTYYFYFNRMIKLFSTFLESLNKTLMPNTYSSGKMLRFSNNQYFFICYSSIKKVISENLTEFKIDKFIKPVNSIIVFYHGYRNFVTEQIRADIEKSISLLIQFLTDKEFLKVISKEYKSTKEIMELNKLKNDLYKLVLKLYSRINEEHSLYDLNPKIERKVYIDKTGI